MVFPEIRPRSAVKMGDIFRVALSEQARERTRLMTYVHDMYEYHAYEGALTLVMNRDLAATAELSSAVALHVALKHPQKNVLLFNTIASGEQLTRGFVAALN